jgi:hypothetical protein
MIRYVNPQDHINLPSFFVRANTPIVLSPPQGRKFHHCIYWLLIRDLVRIAFVEVISHIQ